MTTIETLAFAIAVAILAFASGLIGLRLRTWLPARHAVYQARDMIAAMSGLLGLLLALVLGMLIGASYTLYATQKAELETLAARTLQLDAALENYGPEAKPARDGLRAAIKQYDKIWAGGSVEANDLTVRSAFVGMKKLDQFLLSLSPQTDAQKQVLATANVVAGLIQQTRLLMMLQLAGGISWPMLAIVVCWSLVLFCGYGLVSQVNGTVVATLALGAIAVASAILLILELSQPYSGMFRIPPAGLIQTMQALGS